MISFLLQYGTSINDILEVPTVHFMSARSPYWLFVHYKTDSLLLQYGTRIGDILEVHKVQFMSA